MPLTEYWSRDAALAACKQVVEECVPELPAEAVYPGDLDATMLRPSCRIYAVGEPVERGWTDDRTLSKQAQVWLVTVPSVNVGEVYTTTVLGTASAPYLAQPGDTLATIRNEEMLAVDALGKPVTLTPVGSASFRIAGNTAGQHLGVGVTANMTAVAEALELHDQGMMPSFWVARFEFEEQPGVNGSTSRAPAWATRLRGWLQMGKADAVLRAARLDFNTILARSNFTRPDRGKTTVVEFIDVQFSAIQGLGVDVPSIKSFGTAPAIEVSNDP